MWRDRGGGLARAVMAEPHRIGRIEVRAAIGDADTALALRPRIETLAWRLMPPVLERVCEALGPSDAQLQLGRIDLDLGAVRPDTLEQDALAALERALGEALGEALHRARIAPSDEARLIDPATALCGRFETWLVSGIAPWAPRGERFDPAAMLAVLLAEEPAAVVTLLRRHGRSANVLERLAAQVGIAGLHGLLAALAPADAAQILALIADVILAHRARPAPPLDRLAEPALERLLWIATLELLLRDAGTRFNRRRFLAHLLSREAARLGIDYAALLRLLGDVAAATRDRVGYRAELPQLLTELLVEIGDAPAPGTPEKPARIDLAGALAAARDGDFAALLALVRQLADDRPGIEALVRRLDDGLFAGLVRQLEPAAADAILALLDEIQQSERVAPQPVFAGDAQPVLRWLTLTYLLHDPGTQFNRRRFVAHLLEREARRAGIAYAELVRLLAEASARVTARTGLRASLPAVLDELLDEIAPTEPASLLAEETRALAAARAGDVAALLALLRTGQRPVLWRHVDGALSARLIAALKPTSAAAIAADLALLAALHDAAPLFARTTPEFAALLRRLALVELLAVPGRFSRRAWLARLLRALAGAAGVSEAALRARVATALGARASMAGADALAAVLAPELPAASAAQDAAAALRRAADEPGALDRLAEELAPRDRHRLLAALDAVHADAVAEQFAALSRLHAVAALVPRDSADFERLIWTLAAAWLARTAGTRFDPRALARHLLDGLARAADTTADEIAARLRQAVQGLEGPPPPAGLIESLPMAPTADADLRQRVELFLRTGRPPDAGEDLPAFITGDAPWFVALLRRLARATPADIPALVARLETWLLPEEILACLAPDLAVDALPRDASALIAGLLRGKAIEVPDLPGGGARFDDLARIAYWLDHGSAAWWAPDRGVPLDLLAGLAARSDAELAWLFAGGSRDEVAERLRRAILPLDAAARRRLFERLAPWATVRGGALAPLLAGRDAAGRLDVMVRAAAAALDGAELDLAALAEPLPVAPAPAPAPPVPPMAGGFDLARLLAWLDGAPASATEAALYARWFAEAVDRKETGLVAHLRAGRSGARARARWAAILPPEALGRIVHLFAPHAARGWIDAALLLAAARRRTAPFGARRLDPARLWALLLDLAAQRDRDIRRGVDRLVTSLADDAPSVPLRAEAARLAAAAGDAALATALRNPPAKAPAKEPSRTEPVSPSETEEPPVIEDGDPIFIANAGLVLLAPYLPTLFERLGVMTSGEEGKQHIGGIEAMSRAVHLLQYMADQRLDAPEHELVLNKLLCGLATAQPVLPSFEAEAADLALCDGLLGAVVANWPIIAGTSLDGLRETFLQRDGRLRHEEDTWRLQVQRKGVDVLVDRVPWSFATIFHRWMPQPLQVTW